MSDEIVAMLWREVEEAGTIEAVANRRGLCRRHLGRVLMGKEKVGPRMRRKITGCRAVPDRKPGDLITAEELRCHAEALCLSMGRRESLAVHLGINHTILSRVLNGGRIGPSVAEAMGYRKVVRYQKI